MKQKIITLVHHSEQHGVNVRHFLTEQEFINHLLDKNAQDLGYAVQNTDTCAAMELEASVLKVLNEHQDDLWTVCRREIEIPEPTPDPVQEERWKKTVKLLPIARKIAYPRRGTAEGAMTVVDAAEAIQRLFRLDELELLEEEEAK